MKNAFELRTIAAILVTIGGLTACGGGGGSGAPGGPPTQSPPTQSPPTPSAPTTFASGTVVDDANGTPLAGVSVKLMPWAPCGATPAPSAITPESDGCPTPLPSPQVTTAPNGTFTLGGVPNGHYLLVIGADAVPTVPPGYTTPPGNCGANPCPTPSPVAFTVQATVHDNVMLTGGNQTLVAPTLATVPAGYTAPAWETNGDYRLATMNATTEMPCLIAWEYERAQNGLPGGTVDEWLLENVRAGNAYAQVAAAGSTLPSISTGGDSNTGGVSCAEQIATSFGASVNAYATDPRTLWFGGRYLPFGYNGNTNVSAMGLAEFPIDPRSYTDPNHPIWP